jgi:hypothetical protein
MNGCNIPPFRFMFNYRSTVHTEVACLLRRLSPPGIILRSMASAMNSGHSATASHCSPRVVEISCLGFERIFFISSSRLQVVAMSSVVEKRMHRTALQTSFPFAKGSHSPQDCQKCRTIDNAKLSPASAACI